MASVLFHSRNRGLSWGGEFSLALRPVTDRPSPDSPNYRQVKAPGKTYEFVSWAPLVEW